jgi:hypothetical protein
MLYQSYRQAGLVYGSGVVETGCRAVIGQRLKNSGMFWTEAGARSVVGLRCALKAIVGMNAGTASINPSRVLRPQVTCRSHTHDHSVPVRRQDAAELAKPCFAARYCFGRVVRSWSQPTSMLPWEGVAVEPSKITPLSFTAGIVRESRQRWISACPSQKEIPQELP